MTGRKLYFAGSVSADLNQRCTPENHTLYTSMAKEQAYTLENREISWLSFNARVLQEAEDPNVPLLERLSFLAIYSSNLDEFFRVRVASMRSLVRLKKKSVKKLDFNPARLVRQINEIVTAQQERFGAIWRSLLPALEAEGIFLLNEQTLTETQQAFLQTYFEDEVAGHLEPVALQTMADDYFVKNRTVYLATEIWRDNSDEPDHMLMEVPTDSLPRFVELPAAGRRRFVMFIEDVIRFNINKVFPDKETGNTYAIKLSRDADLYLEDEFSGDLVEMIRKSLKKRDTGLPTRCLYDLSMPFALAALVKEKLKLNNSDMVLGGRYHNLHDLFGFPRFDKKHLMYKPMPQLDHPQLHEAPSMLEVIAKRDVMLHFPFQSYNPVIRFFEEAAADEQVEEIWASLYRVASKSAITQALIAARKAGKKVTVFVEVKARFDEESNLYWAAQMEEAGVKVLYSMPGLKVHAKIAMVVRREGEERVRYCYLGTGNFNEKTARIYVDEALLTSDERLTKEISKVFQFLNGKSKKPSFEHLLVAPFNMRKRFNAYIDQEIAEAEAGRKAEMTLKMNSLEDEKIIMRLYKASQAGVKIRIVVRGICRLIPGIPGQSENIEVTSIVDRYLEHARVYLFHNAGKPVMYLASADWMKRNLSRRIEVAFPIYNRTLFREMKRMLDIQLRDNVKARIIDAQHSNTYVKSRRKRTRAQYASYELLGGNV